MPLTCIEPQCDYTRRNGLIMDMMTQFCPNCGNRLQPAEDAVADAPPRVSRGRRFGAYLIDAVVAAIIEAIASVPGIGTAVTIVLALFWLLRDINGASPGKTVCGLVVENRAGGPSTANQRIIRNLPFAVVVLPLVIPALGIPVAYTIQLVLVTVEALLVLANGDRLGDKLAGTKVVRRSSAPQYYSAAAS